MIRRRAVLLYENETEAVRTFMQSRPGAWEKVVCGEMRRSPGEMRNLYGRILFALERAEERPDTED